MVDGFNRTPHSWQIDAISHVVKMTLESGISHPSPVLCVRSTGGGKSAVRDTIGHVFHGVCLTITPLLSLGADQVAKLAATIQDKPGRASIKAYHLDEVRLTVDEFALRDALLSMPLDTAATVYLFASPQAIVHNPIWSSTVDALIQKGLLRLLCIDEAHLFAKFGLYFRS